MDKFTRYIPAEILKLIQDKTYRLYDFKVSFYIKGVGHQYGDMTNPTAFKVTLMNDTEMVTYIFPSIPDAYDAKGNVHIDKFNS